MSKRSVIWSLFQNHSLIWWSTLPFKNFSSLYPLNVHENLGFEILSSEKHFCRWEISEILLRVRGLDPWLNSKTSHYPSTSSRWFTCRMIQNIHREKKGLEGGASSLGDEGQNYGGGGEIEVRNFKIVLQIFWGVILPIESKLTTPHSPQSVLKSSDHRSDIGKKDVKNTKTQRLHRQNDNQQHSTKQHYRTKEDTKEKLKHWSLGRHKHPDKTETSREIYWREICDSWKHAPSKK